MPVHRLHLVLDDVLDLCLWAREQIEPGRSRPLADLGVLADRVPPPLDAALDPLRGMLRQRVPLPSGRRVPAAPLGAADTVAVMDAVRALLGARTDPEELGQTLAAAAAEGSTLELAEGLIAMPDLVAAALADEAARTLVQARRVIPEFVEAWGSSAIRWAPLQSDGTPFEDPLLCALVDARCRIALAEARGNSLRDEEPPVIVSTRDGHLPAPELTPATLLDALGPQRSPVATRLPQRRALEAALSSFLLTARATVRLGSGDARLVVRLHEPPLGSAWPLQVCLRERDGTVHPVETLRAVGDLSAVEAAQAAAEVLRCAPALRESAVDDTGLGRLLSTAQASRFLAEDAALLEDAGITVMLPRPWTRVPARLVPEVTDAPAEQPGARVGVAAMASFSWRLAVGDTELSEDEIAEIRAAQTELVHLRGQWVRLDRSTLRAAERFLETFSRRRREGSDATGPTTGSPASGRAGASPGGARTGALRRGPGQGGASLPDMREVYREIGTGPAEAERERQRQEQRERALGGIDGLEEGSADDLAEGPARTPADASAVASSDAPGDAPAAVLSRGDLPLRTWFAMLNSAEMDGVHVDGPTVSGEFARILDPDQGVPRLPAPRALRATLRPYQQRGLEWLWVLDDHQLGAILADDMGLGKTMQILALLCFEREVVAGTVPWLGSAGPRAARRGPDGALLPAETPGERSPDALPPDPFHVPGAYRAVPGGEAPGPTLLVCPMSVVGSWQREAERFAPHLTVHVHHGGNRVRDAEFAAGARETDLVITTYSLLARDLRILQQVPWHRVILDEAQHVKNPETAVTRAARALPGERRIALTGTPVENRLADLHSLMEAVNPGLLGSAQAFEENIARPIQEERDESARSRLARMTGPLVLRRVKTDRAIIRDLPEKTEITQSVNLTPEQAGLYEAVVHEMLAQVDQATPNRRRAVVVSALTRLKQVCNHPAHYLGDGSGILRDGKHRSGKIELVDDILGNAFADGQKVLLFTQFTTFGRMLVPYWQERFGLRIPFLHGGLSKPERDAMVAQFQGADGEPGAMLLSLRAGGTGLTLTAANHVVHLDRWWNPAVENQATDRAFRIGQRRDVQVRKLVAAGTIEERIDQVLSDKSELADLSLSTGEGWVARLDDETLARMFALDRSQVSEDDPGEARA